MFVVISFTNLNVSYVKIIIYIIYIILFLFSFLIVFHLIPNLITHSYMNIILTYLTRKNITTLR